jgi:peptidoglycan DL-endopeptidase LytE
VKKEEVLVLFAKKHLGKPYKYGAKHYEAPKRFDCSSFIQYLYKRIGVRLPHTAIDQASCGKTIPTVELLSGDLRFFKGSWGHYNPEYPTGIGHVGIYVGEGKVINARSKEINGKEAGKVIEEPVGNFINRPDFVIARRIL